jgi:hypothetical protein
VRRFCRAWAVAIHAKRGQGDPDVDAAALEAVLWEQAVPGMREIVVNPLLLTILAGCTTHWKARFPNAACSYTTLWPLRFLASAPMPGVRLL